jgi:hypothetical protein
MTSHRPGFDLQNSAISSEVPYCSTMTTSFKMKISAFVIHSDLHSHISISFQPKYWTWNSNLELQIIWRNNTFSNFTSAIR